MAEQTALPPILVSTREARRLLANMSHDKFWQLAGAGAFGKRVGPKQKRLWFYENLQRYAENLKSKT